MKPECLALDNFGPKATQMLQMVRFGTISDHFGPKATQMLQKVSFGTILDNFGSKVARKLLLVPKHALEAPTDSKSSLGSWLQSKPWRTQSSLGGWLQNKNLEDLKLLNHPFGITFGA